MSVPKRKSRYRVDAGNLLLVVAGGMVLLAIAVLLRTARYPRWSALILNSVTPLLIAEGASAASPPPISCDVIVWRSSGIVRIA
ncbi:hypothetical protein [Sphingomonas oryzagri]